MKVAKYALAYVGLAGFSVAVEASVVTVTPGNPGSWNYETAGYGGGGYVANPPSTIPIVANPAAPGTGGSVQLITTAGGANAAAQISTTAYDGHLLSSINTLSFVENSVVNNGQATPYIQINVSLNQGGVAGAGGQDTLFFEPTYQTIASGGNVVVDQGVVVFGTWQSWNAVAVGPNGTGAGWWDNNNILVANPRTNTNKLSIGGEGDSRCQADGFKGSIEFVAQINVVSVQWVKDFGWTADRASHPRQ